MGFFLFFADIILSRPMEERENLALRHIRKLLRDNTVPPLEGDLAEIPLLPEIHAGIVALKEKEAVLTTLAVSLRNEVDIRTSAVAALQESESRFKYLAGHDPLTGAMNRRSFMERAAAEIKTAGLTGQPCALVMMDIDHFKQFNDTWGHLAGDAALRHVVEVIGSLLRKNDFLGRYGGEEFVFLFYGADRSTGFAIAERIREAIASSPLEIESGAAGITASFGVAMSDPQSSQDDRCLDALIRGADIALYQAKKSGRNRVICFEQEMRAVASL